MYEEHPVVTYFEKEKSLKAISGLFVLGVITGFLWYNEFPFFTDYWWTLSVIGFLMAILLGVVHYFKFEYKCE